MEKSYSYLKDPRAIAEIKKHQWIESQKKNQELSFSEAALDWINKHGQEWKKIHVKDASDSSFFIERRAFRRFKLREALELTRGSAIYPAEPLNISFFGLTCKTKEYIYPGEEVSVSLPFKSSDTESLVCRGQVARVFPITPKDYEVFLRFDDLSQEKVGRCGYFKNARG